MPPREPKTTVQIVLKDRRIPRDTDGDPDFMTLMDLQEVFTDLEILEMCNRYLRSAENQRVTHKKDRQRKGEITRRVNELLRARFGHTIAFATEEEIQTVVDEISQPANADPLDTCKE